MLLVSVPDEHLQRSLVALGAVAHRDLPAWDADVEQIGVLVGTAPAGVHLAVGHDRAALTMDRLWANRLQPFELNLRTGRRAPRRQLSVLAEPDPEWPADARRLIDRLEFAVGSLDIQIDHIGSTSVPGLAAKDLSDIQVVVEDLDVAGEVARWARRAFVRVEGKWSGDDRDGTNYPEEVVVDAEPGRPVNVNIRSVTDPVWREALLFRDLLRADGAERAAYGEMKRSLESQGFDVNRYSELKMPHIRAALQRVDDHN